MLFLFDLFMYLQIGKGRAYYDGKCRIQPPHFPMYHASCNFLPGSKDSQWTCHWYGLQSVRLVARSNKQPVECRTDSYIAPSLNLVCIFLDGHRCWDGVNRTLRVIDGCHLFHRVSNVKLTAGGLCQSTIALWYACWFVMVGYCQE